MKLYDQEYDYRNEAYSSTYYNKTEILSETDWEEYENTIWSFSSFVTNLVLLVFILSLILKSDSFKRFSIYYEFSSLLA